MGSPTKGRYRLSPSSGCSSGCRQAISPSEWPTGSPAGSVCTRCFSGRKSGPASGVARPRAVLKTDTRSENNAANHPFQIGKEFHHETHRLHAAPRRRRQGGASVRRNLTFQFAGARGDGHSPISGRLGASRWEPDTSTFGRIAVHAARHGVPARKLRAWHQPAPEVITGRQSCLRSRYRVCEGRLSVSIATVPRTTLT